MRFLAPQMDQQIEAIFSSIEREFESSPKDSQIEKSQPLMEKQRLK